MRLLVFFLAPVDQFGNQPENAQPEQDSHERGQMSDGLEGRHQYQEGKAQIEDQIALENTRSKQLAVRFIGRRNDLPAPQQVTHDNQRNHEVDQRGKENSLDD